ncbi:MAG: 2-aminoethylphosphonate--pyruvate transaminase, partial [Lentisphaeria bacterium]
FVSPKSPQYSFIKFYNLLKDKGFVIYPGKVSNADCFRIGNIGHVFPHDIENLANAIKSSKFWENI